MSSTAEHRPPMPSDSDIILNALPNPVLLVGPDGRIQSYTFPASTWVPVERLNADLAQVRVWYPGQGYGHGAVWRSELDLSR